jgi:hypothetical protein
MMMDHATALALQGVLTEDYAPLYAQTLPTLTITPLTSRDRAGPETARAARERITLLPNNIQLFKQLNDQCDKLQRQINVSLHTGGLRKASTRQVRPATISYLYLSYNTHTLIIPFQSSMINVHTDMFTVVIILTFNSLHF